MPGPVLFAGLLGLVQHNIVPGIWLATLVGGFIFDPAFVFAQGHSTTLWYRVGNGHLCSLLALVGFAAGEVLTTDGFLNPLRGALASPELKTPGEQPATLPNLLGVSRRAFAIPIALAGGGWLWYSAGQEPRLARLGGWAWPVFGILLGLLGTAAWHRGEWSLKIPEPRSFARSLISGVVTGISASIASGCNMGHTFSGAPVLAVRSFLASIAFS